MTERAERIRAWAEGREGKSHVRSDKELTQSVDLAMSLSAANDARDRAIANVRRDFTVLDIETTSKLPWHGDLICAGIGGTAHRHQAGRKAARKLLSRRGVVVCHTAFDLRWLVLDGAKLHDDLAFHDTRVMGWLLDGNDDLSLDDLCQRWLGYTPPKVISRVAGQLMFQTASGEKVPLGTEPWEEMRRYNESDLKSTAELYEALRTGLQERDLWELFLRDEVPLAMASLEMETNGLPFDLAQCEELRAHVSGEAEELGKKLIADGALPASFNLGSPTQVADYIFGKGEVRLGDRVELSPAAQIVFKAAKTAARHAFDESDLERAKELEAEQAIETLNDSGTLPRGFTAEKAGRLWAHGYWKVQGRRAIPAEAGFGASVHWREQHKERSRPSTSSLSLVLKNPGDEWIGDLVLHRELTKLHTSFLAKFPLYEHNGRLHGTLNRCGTATGRFSSSQPNLQNIPAHGNYGAYVRGLFRGDIAVGDYSQLEQRIAAHLSEDENLLKAYRDGVDLYGLAASICFGGEPDKDHPQRGLMKTGMLALQYGAGANKLAQLLLVGDVDMDALTKTSSITRSGLASKDDAKVAQELIDKLEAVFPRFFAWRDETIERAAFDGYIETLSGRRRDIEFPDGWIRMKRRRQFRSLSQEEVRSGFAVERQVINTACQGGAADVVSAALVSARAELKGDARLLLQVHDEILVERMAGWTDASLERFQWCCEVGHGFELAVPLTFEAKVVQGWDEKSGGSARHVSSGFQKRLKEARNEGLQSRKASGIARKRREEAKA